MGIDQFLESIRQLHKNCCLSSHCRDYGCEVDVSQIEPIAMALINVTDYQKQHSGTATKLADRIVFAEYRNTFVAAIELKGGNSIQINDALEQIQMGMKLADEMLDDRQVDDWYPLLIFCGMMGSREWGQLQKSRIEFRGERKFAIRRDCGSQLVDILDSIA